MLMLLAMWLLAGVPSLCAMPAADDGHTFTLRNNMKVMVLEDHAIPNVTLQIFFKTRYRNLF